MVVALIIAVAVFAIGTCLLERLAHTDPRSEFVFAVLDRFVSDESPLEFSDGLGGASSIERCSKQAA
jgi:hypothetical protein